MADNRPRTPPPGPATNRPAPSGRVNEPRRNEPRPAETERPPAPNPARPQPKYQAPNPPVNQPKTSRLAPLPKPPRTPRGPLPGVKNVLELLRDRRFHLFIGFGFLLASLFLTIAFTSFLFTGHADQSVVAALGTTPVKEAGQESGNWLGLIGAWAAQLFIYKLFGVAAFALIPVVFFVGYKIVFRTAAGSVSYVLALGLFTMAWLSTLLGYVVVSLAAPGADPVLAHRLDFLSGGVGFEAASWLDSLLGWGSVLLLAFVLISFVVFFFNVTSINLGFSRDRTEQEEDAELEAELAAEAQAAAVPQVAAVGEKRAEKPAVAAAVALNEEEVPTSVRAVAPGKLAPAGPAFEVAGRAADPEFDPAPSRTPQLSDAASGASLVAGGMAAAGLAATAPAVLTGAAAPLAAALGTAGAAAAAGTASAPAVSSGPAFSIEMTTPDEPEIAPTPLTSGIPTPLSLADLADGNTPAAAPNRNLELTVPGRDDLDPNAGAAIAAVADEDADADVMPDVNYDPTLDLSRYIYPTLDLLNDYGAPKMQVSTEELAANKDRIVETLGHYNIGIASIKATVGPTVTLYEIVPEIGIRIAKIKSLEDDIALSLAALGIRIIAPIPGKGTIGIEVPNTKKEMVSIRSVLGSEKFARTEMDLPVAFGRTITNEVFVADLAKMPHLLMAGATGQGKSVGLNVILASLLYKRHPAQLKFVLVDPKKVELSIFNKIERHFLAKLPDVEEAIITDTKKVVHTLNSLCMEMDRRYDLLKEAGCRNLKEYNIKFIERRLNPRKGHRFLPFIVLVIDELADLMMTAGKEVETPIARLAQLARAIGIHLIVATQRPR